ncbi:hypothetical protein [Staphylococcus xylosus]
MNTFQKMTFTVWAFFGITAISSFVYIMNLNDFNRYDNPLLAVLTLLYSTGLTSVYNRVTYTKKFKPQTDSDLDLRESFKDNINIMTVLINVAYLYIVYVNSVPTYVRDNVAFLMVTLWIIFNIVAISKIIKDRKNIKRGLKYFYKKSNIKIPRKILLFKAKLRSKK